LAGTAGATANSSAADHHDLALIADEDSILSVYEGTSKP
jgi:hypothetical protein